MKDENKRVRMLKMLLFLCILLSFIVTIMAVFFETFGSVAITVAILLTIGMIMLMVSITNIFEKRFRSIEEIIDRIHGYAEVKYNKRDETAYISRRFSLLTGIDVASEIVDDIEYRKIMTELVSCPSDAGSDIYMTARPESWVRVSTYENEYYEFTIVSDVSEYVSCRNIVRSLRYYDSETGLLSRDAFVAKVRTVSETNTETIGLISIIISGIDKVSSFKGSNVADSLILKASSFIKRFENPHNAFAGRMSSNELCLLLTDTYSDGCSKFADNLYNGISEALVDMNNSGYIHIYCGFALFDNTGTSPEAMIAAADYAAHEAQTLSSSGPIEFDKSNFAMRAQDFKKINVFNIVTSENKIDYHFQPIIDANTGDIFGYEALMRPQEINSIKLAPTETLKIAKEQNMSDRIEYLTINNLMKYLSENLELFSDKRLFINTLPDCCINNDEYAELFEKYSQVFDRIIIEITEGGQVTPEMIELMKKRYGSRHAQFALDDYGAGYANDSTLLSIQPDFIKIDRSLVSDIERDPQKRHLVANMISFAKRHGIKTLSEGVETRSELETVITLGIDYIQGYYIGRPEPVIVSEIDKSVRKELLDINIRNIGYEKKVYKLEDDGTIDLEALAVQGYTDVVIYSPEATLKSNPLRQVDMRIICEDGYCGKINMTDLNVFGLEGPVLTLGKDCDVVLEINGRNIFSYEGIRVPESSHFVLKGDGKLRIDVTSDEGTVLGGNYYQDYGAICLSHTGELDIDVTTTDIVAIGGCTGGENSQIEIASGKVSARLRGVNIVGIGSVSGNSDIILRGEEININCDGRNIVAVGSMNSSTRLNCSGNLSVACGGDRVCAVGTLDGGSGLVTLNDAMYKLTVKSKYASVIGAIEGNVDVTITGGEYILNCEGNNVTLIGDRTGSGNIEILGGNMKLYTAASVESCIGTAGGGSVVSDADIVYEGRGKIKATAPDGSELKIIEKDENSVEFHSNAV